MELVNPGIGLIVWMTLAFGAILYILGKYAWKPIMKALKERESSIHDALNSAEKAKEEMKKMEFSNEQLLLEAKNERDIILSTARKIKESIIEESKQKASEEANRIIVSAKESIQNEKMAAMTDLKNQLAKLSLEVAKKILKKELSDPKKQEEYSKELMKDVKFN
ncbi:MAG TPA: F0F1 ATP synthase subunit B [Bacteroidales bacterium]|nr:F0F1 ATP synthase subunit B [Bacteroidales bacterium]